MSEFAASFIEHSRRYLTSEYPAKIRLALDRLPAADLWWRPNAASNSAGNLVLHLAGNVRQWIVHGLGGRADRRARAAEFAADGPGSTDDLLAVLESSLSDADAVLAALDPAALAETFAIQGLSVTGLAALYHVVEHFSMHTGQILYVVKLRTGVDLGFYDVDAWGRVRGTSW